MGALLDRYRAAGIAFVALPDGDLRASGPITELIREGIRVDKAAILADLAANDAATPEHAGELRRLIPRVCRLVGEDDIDGCLARALADPDAALTCYRALLAEHSAEAAKAVRLEPGENRMRTCRDCRNLAPSGRCLAAARRENFGVGIGVSARYESAPDLPHRCGPFVPLPGDPDQRTGCVRWAFLYTEPRI